MAAVIGAPPGDPYRLLGEETPESLTPAAAVQFFAESTVLWRDHTQAIPFRLADSAPRDVTLAAEVDGSEAIEILREPAVLAGNRIGFLRVRSRGDATATLRIRDASLVIETRPDAAFADPRFLRPVWAGPPPRSVVWGRFSVGIELFDDPQQRAGSPHDVWLSLPGEIRVRPQAEIGLRRGPVRRFWFEVDAAALGGGETQLVAVAVGTEGQRSESSPLVLSIAGDGQSDAITGECEAIGPTQRPPRFGSSNPATRSDIDASGGRYVHLDGPRPACCLPFEIPADGDYQLMMRVAGQFGGGAFPSISLYVDDANRPATSARLVAEAWHRIPIGVPIPLEAGFHVITPHFANDFYARGLADRNLYLDQYELRRVRDRRETGPASRPRSGVTAIPTAPTDHPRLENSPIAIGLGEPLDGLHLHGILRVEAFCRWQGAASIPPPTVTLWVNGVAIGRQRSPEPVFWLHPGNLRAGENRVQLVASLNGGGSAATPVQTVVAPPSTDPPRAFHRYSVTEPEWQEDTRRLLAGDRRPPGHRVLVFRRNGTATLNLPRDLTGRFGVYLQAHGDSYRGRPRAGVTLVAGERVHAIAETEVPGGYRLRRVGSCDFPEGAKRLEVSFLNDAYDKGKGDRNLRLQSVVLYEEPLSEDKVAPRVAVRYPGAGHRAYLADAVIADISDNDAVAWAELWIDRRATPLRLRPRENDGTFVFPLLVRDLPPGEHHLAIRAMDLAGNATLSPARPFSVLAEAPSEPLSYTRAVDLLNRFAFGPDPRELAAILTLGEKAYLDDRLGRGPDDRGDLAAWGNAKAHYPRDDRPGQVTQRVLRYLLLTPNPVRARFVQWAENHFSTWMRKTGAAMEWSEYARYARLGAVPFGSLLRTSATSPTLLFYLDQHRSFARQLNENYAREVMELHTLGVDAGYAQGDVTRLAHILTGWTVTEEANPSGAGGAPTREFRFDPDLCDPRAQRVFGAALPAAAEEKRFDRIVWMLEVLAAHPSTARFIARKLAEHYVSVPAPANLVDDLAREFHAGGGDLKVLLRTLAVHPDGRGPNRRLKAPLDYALSISRACGSVRPGAVAEFLKRSGTGIFDRPTPDGYPPEDAAYANSNALLRRWTFAQGQEWRLLRLIPPSMRTPPSGMNRRSWARALVDLAAVRLIGVPLGAASHQAAVEVFEGSRGNRTHRLLALVKFLAQSPEAQLR